MEEKELRRRIRPMLRPVGIINTLSIFMIFSSIPAWIWYDWSLAWKLFLTGVFFTWISSVIYNFFLKKAKEIVEREQFKK